MGARDGFRVRFWGVRGTVPCPGPRTLRYGGNTACVEVQCDGERLILDAGTGIRELGMSLAKGAPERSHILLTHTHIDHINGLPFFRPAYCHECHFEIWAGHLLRQGRNLKEVLATIMQTPYFPVPLDILHACVSFHDFESGEPLEPVPGIAMRTCALNHPGGATGYRVDFRGRSMCYVTDTEHREGEPDQTVLALIEGADLVIYDAAYTDEEFPEKRGWGHSTWQEGVRLCEAAGAGRLVLFHHSPDHDDAALDRIAAALERRRPGSLVAREGMELLP
jgi:phosphoribosyl 1,2-cyclic phosphodiesterase